LKFVEDALYRAPFYLPQVAEVKTPQPMDVAGEFLI